MKYRILLVDDEPRNLSLLEALLLPLGYDTRAATDGKRALELFQAVHPDLVLLDYEMPGLGGLQVLESIRADKERGDVPVIMVTGHAEREHRVRAVEAGVDEFLEKPIDLMVLRARVKMLLALKASRDDLRRSRDAIGERNRELERIQREQRELMEFLVHDLKNPLMIVTGNLEYVRQTPELPESVHEAVEDASDAAVRLRVMVDDLLTVSRLEHAQFPLQTEAVDVEKLFRAVTASFERKAREKSVTLSVSPLSGLTVTADTTLLQRVVENIVDNSFRHTPPSGKIELEAHVGADVAISISNSGPPIPIEDRQRVFEKFARLGPRGNDTGNVGLGLYFCKRAVEAHAGYIDVTETTEWPTSFVIHLPS